MVLSFHGDGTFWAGPDAAAAAGAGGDRRGYIGAAVQPPPFLS
jgi:hypothetical protein